MILKKEKEREEKRKAEEEKLQQEMIENQDEYEVVEIEEETEDEEIEASKPKQKKVKKEKKKKASMTFPWWCKVIAYFLSALFASISLFFTAIKGIALGDEMVSKWLTSLLTSFVSSVFLTQPVQVKKKYYNKK